MGLGLSGGRQPSLRRGGEGGRGEEEKAEALNILSWQHVR